MTENEVKALLWIEFSKWMTGQTLGVYKNGEIDYYEHDVEAYLVKIRTGWDRQQSPGAWD